MRLPGNFEWRLSIVAPKAFLVAAICCWGVAALSLSGLTLHLVQGSSAAVLTYVVAVASAVVASLTAAVRAKGSEKAFWAALMVGLLFRFAGDTGWGEPQVFEGKVAGFTLYDAAYIAYYALFFAALLWLVAKTVKRITPLAFLDSLCIMLSVGMLAWYFVLGPAAKSVGGLDDPFRDSMTLSGAACDAAFLSLSLIAGSATRRRPFVPFLTVVFVAFLLADGSFIEFRSSGPYRIGGWPDLAWALGFIVLSVGALRSVPSSGLVLLPEIGPFRVFSFWLGPLSPALQYAFLLGWAATHPPVPSYVLVGGTGVVAYLAVRISIMSYVAKKLRLEQEMLAVREEQVRISEELHDTLKQSVYSVSFLLGAYRRVKDRGSLVAAEQILDQAVEASQEANYLVGSSIQELRTVCANSQPEFTALLREVLHDIKKYFGVEVHEDLEIDLDVLDPNELAATYRIASEALWNAGKHSGAKNVWLESRRVGSVVLVKVRDDGCGIPEGSSWGMGLPLMKARAEQAGGSLDVISNSPLGGTTVQVRFEKK